MSDEWKPIYWRIKGNTTWARGEIKVLDSGLCEVRESWYSYGKFIYSQADIETKPRDQKGNSDGKGE